MRRTGSLMLLLAAGSLAIATWQAPARSPSGPACLEPKPSLCGFLGIGPQTVVGAEEMDVLRQAGIAEMRLPLYWFDVEAFRPVYERPDWSRFDLAVRQAATHGVRVLPFVWGTPAWVARDPRIEPVATRHARWHWRAFLRKAVQRYGPTGDFWEENPDLPSLPIRTWQIWNEPNIVPFSRRPNPERHAKLLRLSSRTISSADPGARVVSAGLFGGAITGAPNIESTRFLDGVLRARPGHLDGIALHPYVADASRIGQRVRSLRRALRRYGRGDLPLWVTEVGWGSDGFESQWERGRLGQAEELEQAMQILVGNRRRWRIARVYWFTLRDAEGQCQFCDSAGLFDLAGRPKPAWYAFVRWAARFDHSATSG